MRRLLFPVTPSEHFRRNALGAFVPVLLIVFAIVVPMSALIELVLCGVAMFLSGWLNAYAFGFSQGFNMCERRHEKMALQGSTEMLTQMLADEEALSGFPDFVKESMRRELRAQKERLADLGDE